MTTALLPPTPDRAEAVALGEHAAFVELISGLSPGEWDKPTDCAGWSVRDVVAHVAGALEEGAHIRAQLRRVALAPRRYPQLDRLDAINQLQVDDRGAHPPDRLVHEVSSLGPRAARARRRTPQLIRSRAVPRGFSLPTGATFGYLVDVIYPRDLWMHRIDVARATNRDLRATSTEADVVALVVRDLACTWGGPATTLTLTGHGAGTWALGAGKPVAAVETDAVEICRHLSGRVASPPIAAKGDPGAEQYLLAARIPF